MPGKYLFLALGCLALLLAPAWASPVRAESGESAEYREAVEQALSEYASKNYDEASTLFGRAHQLYPNARTERGLGMVAFELRRYPESIEHLEAALASSVKPLEGDLRSETEALLVRARSFMATVTVELQPVSAELLLDGDAVEPYEPIKLPLGEHVFEVRIEGRSQERRVVRLKGGEMLQLKLTVSAEPAPVSNGTKKDKKRPLYKNGWLWASVGAVVAGAAATSIALATRKDGDTEVVPLGTPNTPTGVALTTQGGQ